MTIAITLVLVTCLLAAANGANDVIFAQLNSTGL